MRRPNKMIEPMTRSGFTLNPISGAIDVLLVMAHPGHSAYEVDSMRKSCISYSYEVSCAEDPQFPLNRPHNSPRFV